MAEPRVSVFFYGSFIDPRVLAEVDVVPESLEVARLPGFDIVIGPLANLVRSDRDCVYGVVCRATHAELARLYGQAWVGTYLPEAVVVETAGGRLVPALCYLAPDPAPARPAPGYVEKIVGAGRAHGFPDWYLERLAGFRLV
jgi:hypothetical protein